jgi:hypothetical protein
LASVPTQSSRNSGVFSPAAPVHDHAVAPRAPATAEDVVGFSDLGREADALHGTREARSAFLDTVLGDVIGLPRAGWKKGADDVSPPRGLPERPDDLVGEHRLLQLSSPLDRAA